MILQSVFDNVYFSIFFWVSLFVVTTLLFIFVMVFSHRYYYHADLIVHLEGEKKIHKKSISRGKRVSIEKIVKDYKIDLNQYKLNKIVSDSSIEEGDEEGFIMPSSATHIYFSKVKKEEKVIDEDYVRHFFLVPSIIKEMEEKEVKPVILLDLEDIKDRIREDNSCYLFPLVNRYLLPDTSKYQVLVAYVDKIAYAIFVYSEVTFKVYFRIDKEYANTALSSIDSLSYEEDDIYSVVLDASFTTNEEFLSLIDRSYHYALDVAYKKENVLNYVLNVDADEFNSVLLKKVDYIPREFDPVFEKASKEARIYKEYLARLKEREDALDEDLVSQKEQVIIDIERKQEFISPIQKDEYIKPLSFSDDKEEEHEDIVVNTVSENEKVMGLIDTNNDIIINDPSSLVLENVIDYIISHNEMVNLVVDVSTNMKKTPTSLKFLSSYFALIYQDKNSFKIVIRQDKYVVNELIKLHPNIVKTYNGSEDDWYTLYVDSSYTSYDELYSIFLSSYNYTKTNYYKKISSRK